VNPPSKGYKFTNQRLKDLGMEFVPVLQSIYEDICSGVPPLSELGPLWMVRISRYPFVANLE
jgi:hypothetical protein